MIEFIVGTGFDIVSRINCRTNLVHVPPHIHVLKESSRFSPPQISNPLSYVPRRSKKARSIEKRPPAMVGDHTGSAGFLCLFFSLSGTACQLN